MQCSHFWFLANRIQFTSIVLLYWHSQIISAIVINVCDIINKLIAQKYERRIFILLLFSDDNHRTFFYTSIQIIIRIPRVPAWQCLFCGLLNVPKASGVIPRVKTIIYKPLRTLFYSNMTSSGKCVFLTAKQGGKSCIQFENSHSTGGKCCSLWIIIFKRNVLTAFKE